MNAFIKTFCVVLTLGGLAAAGPVRAADSDREVATSINHANALLHSGDVKAALQAYENVQKTTAENTDLTYDLGVAQYRKGDLAAAERNFTEAATATSDPLAAKARYNLGNCSYAQALRQAETDHAAATTGFNKAIDSYRSALELDPADIDARANIELASAMIDKLRQQDQQQQKQQNQQKKDEQQKQDQKQQNSQQDQKQNQGGQNKEDSQKQDQQQKADQQNKSQQQQQQSQKQDQKNKDNQQQSGGQDQQKNSSQDQSAGKQDQPQNKQSDQQTGKDSQQSKNPQPQESKSQESKSQSSEKQNKESTKPSEPKDSQNKSQQESGDKQPQSSNESQQNSQQKNDQQSSAQRQANNERSPKGDPGQPGDPQAQEGAAAPKGALTTSKQDTEADKQQEGKAAAQEEGAVDGPMTKQEAEKMLQAIRDQEMIRRLRRQAVERNQHIPVDKDW